ncbi:MAG: NAD(P)H-hydrate epimerase, partial [Calditrichaeota bacterium]|nr:NAD(P)H-hydrate epimerase [Calditrichota bacterium]
MKSVSAKFIKELDRFTISDIGIPSLVLMENAGRLCAEIIIRRAKKYQWKNILVFCGQGNNGGDGFVIARYLMHNGFTPMVLLMGKELALKEDARVNYQIYHRMGGSVIQQARLDNNLKKNIQNADCIIDAVFGVGLNRE